MALLDPSKPNHKTAYILGITNPFLLQRMAASSTTNTPSSSPLANKPYILALNSTGVMVPGTSSFNQASQTSLDTQEGASKGRRLLDKLSSKKKRLSANSPTGSSSEAMTRIDVPGTPLHTQAIPSHFLKEDKSFLATLPTTGATHSTTIAIRRHFADLTARILAPINRFLLSNSNTAVTNAAPGGAQQFPIEAFMRALSHDSNMIPFVGATAGSRTKARDEFYGRFCRTPNFTAWMDVMSLTQKQEAAGMLSG
jgi:hypothetical protein